MAITKEDFLKVKSGDVLQDSNGEKWKVSRVLEKAVYPSIMAQFPTHDPERISFFESQQWSGIVDEELALIIELNDDKAHVLGC